VQVTCHSIAELKEAVYGYKQPPDWNPPKLIEMSPDTYFELFKNVPVNPDTVKFIPTFLGVEIDMKLVMPRWDVILTG
jgi:hypothetical protein